MAALDKYKDLSQCLVIIKQKCDITNTLADALISGMLDDSAGLFSDASTVYRPYFVAANIISQSTDYQNLKKAGSVEFTGMASAIESLLRYQNSLDQVFNLIIPPGMEAIAAIATDGVVDYIAYMPNSTSVRTTVT